MSIKADIISHLTNHFIHATLFTVLSEANYVGKNIRSITGYKSDASLDFDSGSASFKKHEKMADDLASFIEIDKETHLQTYKSKLQVILKLIPVSLICFSL